MSINLSREELLEVSGGGWMQVVGAIAGVFTFLAGLVDGIFRPLKCEK